MWKLRKTPKVAPNPDLPQKPEHDLFDHLGEAVIKDSARGERYQVPCPIHNKEHDALAFDHQRGPQTWICMEQKPYQGGTLAEYLEFEKS
jgi:hypothetical protein